MEANSLLYFLIHQCHQCLQHRLWEEDGLWVAMCIAVMMKKATACNRVFRFTSNASTTTLSCLSTSLPSSLPPASYQTRSGNWGVLELHPCWTLGLGSVIWKGGGGRGKKSPNINPLGRWHWEASPFRPLANQRLLATSLKPELHAPEGDS